MKGFDMTDEHFGERLEQLETRVAFQDQTIEELNAVITEQWTVIEQMRRKFEVMEEQLRSGSYIADPASEKPPPHY